jgi:hypothetical protein
MQRYGLFGEMPVGSVTLGWTARPQQPKASSIYHLHSRTIDAFNLSITAHRPSKRYWHRAVNSFVVRGLLFVSPWPVFDGRSLVSKGLSADTSRGRVLVGSLSQ